MFKRIRNIFQLQNIYTFIAIVIFGVILNRIKIAHLSKIIPAFVPLLFIVETCREIDRVFIFHQPGFLHEAFIFRVEHIVHQVVFEQSTHPHTTHQ